MEVGGPRSGWQDHACRHSQNPLLNQSISTCFSSRVSTQASTMTSHIGYTRVSTDDQNPELQTDALLAAGCQRVFTDHASGAKTSRPELERLLDHLRPGDVLVVWRLDRLGRSMRHLVGLIEDLADRDVGFRSLTESIDTTTTGGKLVFGIF